ncbi:MAG: enoyl-CoA hydratase/isomerase family protein [Chitinophagaceae bacterium]
MYSTIIAEIKTGILKIIINRPEKLNALNETVLLELREAIMQLRQDQSLRGAIITGSGEKAFVAGADISEFLKADSSEGKQLAIKGQEVFALIEATTKPIIAAVNGFALGGGCELAMSCHFRYASDRAKFGQPEINLGIIPGYGGTQRLTRLIGKGRAMEMMMKGDMIDVNEAFRMGLVNKIVQHEQLMHEVEEILKFIISKPQPALAALIQAVNAAEHHGINGFEKEAEAFASAFSSEEMKEGVTAFLEKRKPNFK